MLARSVVGHWALLLVPIGGLPQGSRARTTLAGLIDTAVFGRHILTATGDPEGLLGTIPAIASALLGSIAGDWLARTRPPRRRVAG